MVRAGWTSVDGASGACLATGRSLQRIGLSAGEAAVVREGIGRGELHRRFAGGSESAGNPLL